MPEATYEILALLMRYVFAALGVLICLTALRWLLREHRVHSRAQRQMPQAGRIGVLEFTDSGEPRRGVEIIPCRRAKVTVNGQKAQAGHYALSGALIQAGDTTLRLRLYKRLHLPSAKDQDSPDPLLSTWDEDDFLPNGMGIPMPGRPAREDGAEDGDIWADAQPDPDRGKLLHMPLFSDDPPDGEEP